ncbi:MAG: hypothetical protein ACHRXM_13240 [Isosphaerales bacterium]
MPIDDIRSAMHQQPFQPFSVRTADGQAYYVRHPDFIATSTSGRPFTVYDDAGHHILDVRLVVGISFHETPAATE